MLPELCGSDPSVQPWFCESGGGSGCGGVCLQEGEGLEQGQDRGRGGGGGGTPHMGYCCTSETGTAKSD